MTESATIDESFMREALHEGEKGLGLTSPNPAVGSVIVRDGAIVGRGWHRVAGGPHAEVEAIADVSSSTKGATIYVTLEPCSTHGKTPPCVEAILAGEFSRVVVGTTDPNPAHAGRGLDLLRDAGLEVVCGVCEKEAKYLLRFFAKRITTGRPWVIAKTAMTLDGKTTLPTGMGQWISCEESREDVQKWRRQCDAILVGGETFRKDNPSLTLRGEYAEGRAQPLRIVLSSDERLPAGHHLFTDAHRERTRVLAGIPFDAALDELGGEGMQSVMLESGGRLFRSALEEELVDEVILYYAPLIGGGGIGLAGNSEIVSRLSELSVVPIGSDVRVMGQPAKR